MYTLSIRTPALNCPIDTFYAPSTHQHLYCKTDYLPRMTWPKWTLKDYRYIWSIKTKRHIVMNRTMIAPLKYLIIGTRIYTIGAWKREPSIAIDINSNPTNPYIHKRTHISHTTLTWFFFYSPYVIHKRSSSYTKLQSEQMYRVECKQALGRWWE